MPDPSGPMCSIVSANASNTGRASATSAVAAAGHHQRLAGGGLARRAADGSVDEPEPARREVRGEGGDRGGVAGAHLDDQRAPLHRRRRPVAAEQSLAHDRRGRQHRDQDVRVAGRVRRRSGEPASGVGELGDGRGRDVVNGEREAPGGDVPRHGATHHAQTDQRDCGLRVAAHRSSPQHAPSAVLDRGGVEAVLAEEITASSRPRQTCPARRCAGSARRSRPPSAFPRRPSPGRRRSSGSPRSRRDPCAVPSAARSRRRAA